MTKEKHHWNIIQTFSSIHRHLPSRRRKQFWMLLVFMIGVAVLETLTVGGIAFFASAVSDPEAVLNSKYIAFFQRHIQADFLIHTQGLIIFLSIMVVALIGCKNLFLGLATYAIARYSWWVSSFIGEMLLKGFLSLPYKWHLNRNSADQIIMMDWRRFFGRMISSSLRVLSDILIISFMLASLLIINPIVSTLVIFVIGGSAYLILSMVRGSLDRNAKRCYKYAQSINRQATKAVHGIKDVKIYGRENFFLKNYTQKIYIYGRLLALQQIISQFPAWILQTVGFAMLTLAICLMHIFMQSSTAKVTGTIVLLAVTAWRVLPAISSILGSLTKIRNSLPFVHDGLQRLEEIQTSKVDIIPDENEIHDFIFQKEIRVENVSFSYQASDFYALKNVSFSILKGQTVGIVGPSGAGKSTLVDILIGLFSPSKGRVTVDGKVMEGSRRRAWTHAIGYVPQSPYIYDGTLAENVAFGFRESNIDRERVMDCCIMAAMQDFMDTLPNGIDTPVGERGVRLSGGQRQRIAIARALYNKPQIIIFDEATSALDRLNENAVLRTIYALRDRMTLIIIAHRLTTVEECDVIVWLGDGNLRMMGEADWVLKSYKRLSANTFLKSKIA